MASESLEQQLMLPPDIGPWLTLDYIKDNGFCVVPDNYMTLNCKKCSDTQFGELRWAPPSEVRAGDIIIFDGIYHEKFTETGDYTTDRFYRVTKEDIVEYQRKERELLPVGVVVHPPKPSLTLIQGDNQPSATKKTPILKLVK